MNLPGRALIGVGLAALSVLVLHAGTLARQDPEDQDERARLIADLKRYHALGDAYWKGDDGSIEQLLTLDRKRLSRIVAAAQTPIDVFQHWPESRIKAAAMLHTDAAFRLLDAEPEDFSFQIELASRVLQLGGAGLHRFARSWYMAVSRSLRDRAQLFLAEGLLERGRRHVPHDAVILYESGVLQEQIATYAAFITVTVTEVPRSRMPGGPLQTSDSRPGPSAYQEEQRRALEGAALWLGQSLQADPSSELAQLHYGRVQALRGRDGEAGRLLRPLGESADPEVSYLAAMFLAALHQRRSRFAEAEALYRATIEKHPLSQAAYVALSELLHTRGRGDDARTVLVELLRKPALERTDAWWWYLGEPVGEARRRMDALRASARR